MEKRRPLTIDDLARIRTASDPQMSPDGAQIAFVVRTMDLEKNKNASHIWIASATRAEKVRQWTRSTGSETTPRWSPDGKWLAFTSGRDEEKSQIFLLPAEGGEAEAITDLPEGDISDVRWSPDGARIAFTFRPQDADRRKEAEEERKKNHRSAPPRTLTRLHYRREGAGFLPAARFHIHVLEIESRAVRQITSGERDHAPFCWSPDGSRIAFVRNSADDPDLLPNAEDLFLITADGAEERKLPCPPGPKGGLAWSPDGTRIAYLGHDKPDEVWGVTNVHPWLVSVEGDAPARDLAPDWDTYAGNALTGDVTGGGEERSIWSGDGKSLLLLVSERGALNLYRVAADGNEPPERVTEGEHAILSFTADARGQTLALLLATPEDAGDIYALPADFSAPPRRQRSPRRRTELNRELFAEAAVAAPVHFEAISSDGHAVPCWALFPPDWETDRTPRPTILYIHGGPHLMHAHVLFHEYQALAAEGYVVLYPNPRGSQGYGEAWTGAIRGNWGEPAHADALACADHAIAQGWSDGDRLGVAGGSYGGYLTAWIIGHTDRFAAAVAERGVYNLHSMAGTCDFVWIDRDYFDANATDDPAEYLRNSPLTYADAITTPLLLIHSEGDRRCPIEQAEQLFAALKRRRKEVRIGEVVFLRYGHEGNHNLSRNGPPDLRLDRQRRIHAWFDKFLKRTE